MLATREDGDARVIRKAKLNSCETCRSKENLHVTFDAEGKLYFLCTNHKFLLNSLITAAAKIGIRL